MKKNNCAKAKNAEDCALTCAYCSVSTTSCEDKKGEDWCGKKTKDAKKAKKYCKKSKSAKKCELTCDELGYADFDC